MSNTAARPTPKPLPEVSVPRPPSHRGHLRLRRAVRSAGKVAAAAAADRVPLAPLRLSRGALVRLGGRGRGAHLAAQIVRPLALLSVHELTERLVAALDARARARHGWAPIDAWNMCSSVPRSIGQQLAWLADEGMSWPHTEEFPTPQSWKGTLRYHALILTTDGYGDPEAEQRLLDDWCEAEDAVHALAARKDSSAEQLAAARAQAEQTFNQLRHGEDLAAASVVGSMTWVAEHIHHLWD